MKQYDVKISHAALSDMGQIYSYIADRLLEPDTAMGQYNRIAEAIQSLNILPERCALVESEPERTQGLRQMLVDNYSVFYIVGEDTVSVARVVQCIRPCALSAENEVKGCSHDCRDLCRYSSITSAKNPSKARFVNAPLMPKRTASRSSRLHRPRAFRKTDNRPTSADDQGQRETVV